MRVLPKALEELIDALGALPGVGPRSAERFAYFLFKQEPSVARRIANEASKIHQEVTYCPKTFALISINESVSPLYDNSSRDKKLVAVVADPCDIVARETPGQFPG
ncbi:MAG: recombination protein RecR, partial [Patescibacteria group bacterium]